MSDTSVGPDLTAALVGANTAIDALLAGDLTAYSDEQTIALLRETERLRRRLAPVDHAQILELERRGVAAATGARTVPQLLCHLLDLDPGEARARHRAAEAAGARRSLLGQLLPPAYPVVAAAQAEGELSARQARVITECVEKLPDAVKHEGPGVEARLVGFARDLHLPPHQLAQAAQRETDWLDPDGKHADVEYRRRQRSFNKHTRPDGSCSGTFEGTAEFSEFLDVVLPWPPRNPKRTVRKTPEPRGSGATTLCSISPNTPCGPGTCPTPAGSPPPWCSP